MLIECFIEEKQGAKISNKTIKEIVFKVKSTNSSVDNYTLRCNQNDLCENISLIFNTIKQKCVQHNIKNNIKETDIIFNFCEEKNITTTRIIKSFISGMNIKN